MIPGEHGVYHGVQEYSRFVERVFGEFDDLRGEIDELIEVGDQILVSLTARGRGRESESEPVEDSAG